MPDTPFMSARVLTLACVLVALVLAAGSGLGLDYQADAGPAISALARGDVHAFVSATPQMGPLSLVARAPLAAAAPTELWAYRAGALLCLLALVALLLGLVRGRSAGVA